jgi:hypothetical protein
MDLKNEGKTWNYQKREKYAGLDINAKNHRIIRQLFIDDFIAENTIKLESGEITESELNKQATEYAAAHIRYNQKMKSAYDKGKTHFKFGGRAEPVRTVEMLQRFQKSIEEIQEKYNNLKQESDESKSTAEGV